MRGRGCGGDTGNQNRTNDAVLKYRIRQRPADRDNIQKTKDSMGQGVEHGKPRSCDTCKAKENEDTLGDNEQQEVHRKGAVSKSEKSIKCNQVTTNISKAHHENHQTPLKYPFLQRPAARFYNRSFPSPKDF
jgi:hypothetical protein